MWRLTSFAKLQSLPTGARAVALWPDKDDALVDVVEGILTLLHIWRAIPIGRASLNFGEEESNSPILVERGCTFLSFCDAATGKRRGPVPSRQATATKAHIGKVVALVQQQAARRSLLRSKRSPHGDRGW